MKRTFCDLCDREFQHKREAIFGHKTNVLRRLHNARSANFNVSVYIEPEDRRSGEHTDICPTCRIEMVKQVLGILEAGEV